MFPATSLPRFGVRRLDGALDIGGLRSRISKSKSKAASRPPHSKMELLAGLEPAASTYDHPSAAAAPGTPVSKRRALPFELQERHDCGLRNSDCGFENAEHIPSNPQFAIRNPQFFLGRGGQ